LARTRLVTAQEDWIGAAPVAVLSHEAWQRYFQANEKIIGCAVSLGDRSVINHPSAASVARRYAAWYNLLSKWDL